MFGHGYRALIIKSALAANRRVGSDEALNHILNFTTELDISRSMETRDVIDEDRPSQPPKTRRESIQPLLSDELWKPVSQ